MSEPVNNNDQKSGETKIINNGVPFEEYEELKNKFKDIATKYEEVADKINEYEKKIGETEKQYQERLKDLEKKYVNTLYKSTGVKDTEYLDFLVTKTRTENPDLDYEGAIEKIKENKPDLFEGKKKEVEGNTPGNKPTGGAPKKKFSEMTLDEKTELFRKDPDLYHKLKNGK